MALNKAKVLRSAEKYVIQGKISHAISEYQKLIKEDPTDLPLVNTLGDLYVRIGNIPEAVKCFTRLAESYDNGGFVVRAIAMYKKVSKIDPGQIQALSRLADLYLRQGLNSDARTHYLQVADSLLRKGDLENAIAIYQKIIEIDPENPAADGRVAEAWQKLGNRESAIAAYVSAGMKARRKASPEDAAAYLKKALDLDSNDIQVLLSYSEVLSELGRAEEALAVINRIPLHDFKPEVLETSFNIYLKSADVEQAERIASQLIELDTQYFKLQAVLCDAFLSKGDLDRAIAIISKAAEAAVSHGQGAIVESRLKGILQNSPEHIPALLALVKFYDSSRSHQFIPALLEKAGAIYVRRDQLAEAASIYLQLVQLEPNDPVHRENLRQVQERLGLEGQDAQLPRLVPEMSAIAERFISEPTLKTIAPEEGAGEPGATSPDDPERIKGFIVEGDLFAGYGLYQKAIDQYQRVLELIPHHIEVREKIRDMYAKSGELTKAAEQCLVLANIYTSRQDTDNANRNFALAYQYDPNLHQQPIYPEPEGEKKRPPADQGKPPNLSPAVATEPIPSKRLEELLLEADFYLDLAFLSEAKASMDQYLQSGRASDPEFRKRQERYESLLLSQGMGGSGAAGIAESASSETAEASEEISLAEFESTSVASPETPAEPEEIEKAAGFETTAVSAAVPPAAPPPAGLESAESFDEMMIDLDQELVESTLEKTAVPVVSSFSPQEQRASLEESAGVAGLEDVFEEFKEGMEDSGESGDYETHYNLGIAFKEMGLLEEAIGEFQKALKTQAHDIATEEFVKCCNMLGLCFVDKGLPQVAVKWFGKGLSSPGRNEETYQALRYDLACAHEMAGNTKAALETFLDVYAVNINYRDVSEKIESLKNRING